MMKNNKALTALQGIIILVVIVVAFVIAGVLLSAPATVENDVKVYIDTVEQKVNYTAPQTLDWGTITAPNTYTRNFTVVNAGTQNYTIILVTTEPYGTTQTWSYNNTLLAPNTYAASNLVYTLSAGAVTGSTTWRLLATNMTMPTATPTPNPSATPTPNSLSFTIDADNGLTNITITKNSGTPFTLLPEQLPKTYLITEGDSLKFQAYYDSEYYTWNGWEFDDGTMPTMNNPLILSNMQGNFTVTAKLIPKAFP